MVGIDTKVLQNPQDGIVMNGMPFDGLQPVLE
jgi:hypothetical protein